MMQTQTSRALAIGAEVWSSIEGSMLRQAAVPSLGDLDKLVGSDQTRLVSHVIDEVCSSRMPRLIPLLERGISALAWPTIDRDKVVAVVVIYLNTAEDVTAAAEVWTGRPGRSELCLADASYAGLDRFGKLSRHISFPKGSGMPGLAWESNIPQIVEGLAQSPIFMRATGAGSEGLDIGFAMPCINGAFLQAVIVLLSDGESPIARAFETWLPQQRGGSLRLLNHEGAYRGAPALEKSSDKLHVPAGDTWIGRAWATRQPELIYDRTGQGLARRGAADDAFTTGIAIPIIVLDDVAAVAVMMW